MDQSDLELIAAHKDSDAELAALYEEHLAFEKILEKLENKPFRTPSDDMEIKDLKKKKLAGKTKMEAILMKYRKP